MFRGEVYLKMIRSATPSFRSSPSWADLAASLSGFPEDVDVPEGSEPLFAGRVFLGHLDQHRQVGDLVALQEEEFRGAQARQRRRCP